MLVNTDLYQQMIEEIEDYAILFLDGKGQVMTWNKGAERIKGYKADEIIGKSFSQFYTQEDINNKLPQSLLEKANRDGKASDEGWRVKKGGGRFWASVLITAVHGDSGEVNGYSKVTRDLTGKLDAQETRRILGLVKEGFFKMLEASPSGMIMTDLDSRRIVQINKVFIETFGYSREEVIGHKAGELGMLTEESKLEVTTKLKQQSYLKNEHVTCFTKNGEKVHCVVSTEEVEIEGRRYLLSAYQNITERIKVEETEKALAQARDGFLKLFNASPSGMIIASLESGQLIEVNESFLGTFGYTRKESIGFTADELGFVTRETQQRSFSKLKEQGFLRNEEVPAITKNGRNIFTIFSVELFEFDGKASFLCIFHDISDLKEMELQIAESEKKYRKLIEEAGDVLYTSNAQGLFTYVNQRVTNLTEYTRDDLVGRHFSMLIAPAWREKIKEGYFRQFKDNIPETVMEFMIHTKSGKEKWVEQVVILQSDKGRVSGFQCVVHDITERKVASLILAEQKQIIEQKNKDILDSINYAKRIQDAIFPPDEFVKRLLPESFVLFRPKDIISGDFYWIEKSENKTFIAAVDCTGHGVPGALLSIIGYNLLGKSVNEQGHIRPGDILNELSKGINNTLRKTAEHTAVKDTMDIALCAIDRDTLVLEYAGAHNSLYVIRNGDLKEIPANRFPIGTLPLNNTEGFTNHQIQLEKGDMIYLFSDGYPDQFGGPVGKKLMYKGFRKILLSIQQLAVQEQNIALIQQLDEWRKEVEQTDDILVIGIKV